MAGDWIKMRVWLRRDPRVASMADFLATDRRFMDHITDPVRQTCSNTVYEHITRDVTRAITVSALLEIWGVARERGDRVGDDLVLKHCDISTLDDICSTPGIGDALEYVDWAVEEEYTDRKGRAVPSVRFPNFFAENESPEDRYKKQHAEAQARYRAKNKPETDDKRDVQGDITRDITVTPREEKRREEINTPASDLFEQFYEAYPRKVGKDAARKAFAKRTVDAALLTVMVVAIQRQGLKAKCAKGESQYVPHPATWLNEGRWQDEDGGTVNDDPYGLKKAVNA